MNIKDKLLNEDKVKRELKRSQDAMNKMFSRKLSKRSRIAKKQRKIAMGPMSKVSVNTSDVDDTSDREDSQTMLNIKDKISETLLNSFNKLLNERSKQSRDNKAEKNAWVVAQHQKRVKAGTANDSPEDQADIADAVSQNAVKRAHPRVPAKKRTHGSEGYTGKPFDYESEKSAARAEDARNNPNWRGKLARQR